MNLSKTIILKQMTFKNFKGIKDLTIDFSKITNIFGDNGTGKTTIFDAFTWLLFDKDSSDRSKFDVQPLDSAGKVIDMQETEVAGVIEVDGSRIILRKVLKQKWVKKRGETESELKGSTTDYYVNEVPQKEKEYQAKISEIIPEDIFKLLTNPLYFSSILDKKERRKIIFDISGDVSQEDVINYNSELADLNRLLNPNEDMESFTKRIKAQRSKLIKDKENIPARVDEASRGIQELDFAALETQKKSKEAEIKSINEQILGSSKVNTEKLNKQNRIYEIKRKMMEIKEQAREDAEEPLTSLHEEMSSLDGNIANANYTIAKYENDKKTYSFMADRLGQKIKDLRKDWNIENSKQFVFPEDKCICPTCKRPFDAEDIETKKTEMEGNFYENKAKTKEKITAEGKQKAQELEEYKAKLVEAEDKLNAEKANYNSLIKQKAELQNKIDDFKIVVDMGDYPEYQKLNEDIKKLEEDIKQDEGSDSSALRSKKLILEGEINLINKQLYAKENNDVLRTRIKELRDSEKRIAQQIADIEKAQYLSDEFVKTKVELLEGSINSKFKFVKIRLFKNQVNGGLEEDCEVMVNGVPFNTSLNSGARINAGLDIINTLSEHYGIEAPIFVDNKESVTKLIDTDCQLINLIVSKSDKKLRIEGEK